MILELKDLLLNRWEFFAKLLLEHLEISLLSVLIAVLLGGAAGILISEFQHLAKPTLGVINFLYTIPSISMLGFLIPFSGVGNTTAIIALTVYALLPMVRNTHTGISHVNPAILEAAKGMGSTQLQILIKIKLPLALPVIMSGIRSMVTMTIALTGIASFIGAGGLGVAIYRGITTNNGSMTLAGSLLIALLALLVDFLLGMAEHHIQNRKRTCKKVKYSAAFIACIVCLSLICSNIFSRRDETIHIATKPMTEQYILGEMLDILIEQDTNLNVEITQGVGGGTSNIQPAMEKGEFDLYPEYTGTGWNMVLKNKNLYTEDQFQELQQEYKDRYQMQWTGMYGFNNTYSLAVLSDVAKQYDLHTYSDLAAVAGNFAFGSEYDFFERKDGFNALCDAYGFHFKTTMDLDIGLKYQALTQKQIDIIVVFTTDGQLSDPGITVLKDDRQFFPSYMCGNIIREKVLSDHPELNEVFKKLTGLISDQDMAQMNDAVESEGKEPHAVAEEFLQANGLIK